MDFQRLENFRYLKKAKEICESQIRETIRSLGELTGVNLGGTPTGGSRLSVQERAVERLESLRRMYEYRLEQYQKELIEVEAFIDGIDNVLTQQVFILRFVKGYSWLKVAMEIGGGNTEDSVRKVCSRYLEKYGN